MFRTFKAVVASLIFGAGALLAAPVRAQADSLYFSLGTGGSRAGVILGEGVEPVQDRDWRRPGWDGPDEPYERDRPRWDRPRWDRPPPREGCSPRRALRKAYEMGLDRPFIARDNARIVVVAGRTYRGREWITFANVPGCPILR